jgi:hypothetical protein
MVITILKIFYIFGKHIESRFSKCYNYFVKIGGYILYGTME